MMIRSLPRSRALLGALFISLLITSCGGDASVSIVKDQPDGEQKTVAGLVQLPNGQLAAATSMWERFAGLLLERLEALSISNLSPVGQNVVVQLVQAEPDDVSNHELPDNLDVIASNSTNGLGQYDVLLPVGTDEHTCRFLLQVGTRGAGTLTRAFVTSTRAAVNVNPFSEAAVRLVLERIPSEAGLCDFSAAGLGSVVEAIQALAGEISCANASQCNSAVTALARTDAGVQAALAAAQVPPTTLALDIQSTDTSIVLVDASRFPQSGAIQIDDERMTYSGKSGNTLTGVVRGAFGTTPVPHRAGARVSLIAAVAVPVTPTPTSTPTPLDTVSDTETPTNTPTATSTPREPTPTIVPGAAAIDLGTVEARLEEMVFFDITLRSDLAVAGIQNDIRFDPFAPIAARSSGRPDCTVNEAIGKDSSTFAFQPPGCSGSACQAARALILSLENTDPIPTGSILYTCKVNVAQDAPLGTLPLRCEEFGASDPLGDPLTTICTDGAIIVLGTLQADISAQADSLRLDSVDGLSESGTIQIDDEIIGYSGINAGTRTLLNLIRGADGTEAAPHAAGAAVRVLETAAPTATPTETPTGPTATPTETPTGPTTTPTETPTADTATPTDTPLTPAATDTPAATGTPTVPPTATQPIATATNTATPVPTDTPTVTQTSTRTSTPTDTPTHTPLPQPPEVNVGSVSGAAGSTVDLPVSLVTHGASISAVSNVITYDSTRVDVVLVDGTPDCNSALPDKASFSNVLEGEGGAKTLRVAFIGSTNNTALDDGTLYTCRFQIKIDAPTGAVALTNQPDASDPQGNAVPVVGDDGQIQVTGAPPSLGLGDVQAQAGMEVVVPAAFRSRGEVLSALAADIAFDPDQLSVVVDGEGNPQCVLDEPIPDKEIIASVLGPIDGQQILRVGIIGRDNSDPLPAEATFSCTFLVAGDAGGQTIVLQTDPDGSTPEGGAVGMAGTDGTIQVE